MVNLEVRADARRVQLNARHLAKGRLEEEVDEEAREGWEQEGTRQVGCSRAWNHPQSPSLLHPPGSNEVLCLCVKAAGELSSAIRSANVPVQ